MSDTKQNIQYSKLNYPPFIGLNVIYAGNACGVFMLAWFFVQLEFEFGSIKLKPRYYQFNSSYDHILYFKQANYGLMCLIYGLLILWLLINYLIYLWLRKKSPIITQPVKTILPPKAVNIFLVVLNCSATAATGILLTVKENIYTSFALDAKQLLEYLYQLNTAVQWIWLLLVLEIIIFVAAFVNNKLSAKQLLQRLLCCLLSYLPFLICTFPLFM